MKPSPDGTVNLVDYIYEQPVAELFGGLVPRYLSQKFFEFCWNRLLPNTPLA